MRRRWEEDKRLEQECLDDQYLQDASYTKDGDTIGWTQHRCVVGMSVAARVVDKMGVRVEDAIGTKPDLTDYAPTRIDASHKGTISPDILLGSFKPDRRLLMSSVTMNAASFGEHFNYAAIFNSQLLDVR
ncbi:hypothetical protein O181_014244 [Austropuccinia psidii MF-1]|uniref:Uncharacterized protein n=1 Tax=Austropuccinia psidii MF-1 TaxID=1389203 RepID=A0A9Q3BZR5_9BASI|nr:hypothetical protein [Austropuccinia psidii MF-1]